MRGSSAVPPIEEWDDDEVREQLCLALREVGVRHAMLPDGTEARAAIERVVELHAEANRRGLDVSARISRLSTETGWDMESLLRDTLAYPEAIPYLASGPEPTCGNCGERIPRTALLALCGVCLDAGLEITMQGRPQGHLDTCTFCGRNEKGFLVYAYDVDYRNYCAQCLRDAKTRYDAVSP